jgi:hypothetical protein
MATEVLQEGFDEAYGGLIGRVLIQDDAKRLSFAPLAKLRKHPATSTV